MTETEARLVLFLKRLLASGLNCHSHCDHKDPLAECNLNYEAYLLLEVLEPTGEDYNQLLGRLFDEAPRLRLADAD